MILYPELPYQKVPMWTDRQTDRHDQKHYLPPFAGGNDKTDKAYYVETIDVIYFNVILTETVKILLMHPAGTINKKPKGLKQIANLT